MGVEWLESWIRCGYVTTVVSRADWQYPPVIAPGRPLDESERATARVLHHL